MERIIRVMLADDHEAVRAGFRELLADTPDIEVVGEASDGQAAVELALAVHPDVVVMDIHMPRLNGIDATRRIRQQWPEARVLGLSAASDPPYIQAMRKAGAIAFVAKTATGAAILQAIRSVAHAVDTDVRALSVSVPV